MGTLPNQYCSRFEMRKGAFDECFISSQADRCSQQAKANSDNGNFISIFVPAYLFTHGHGYPLLPILARGK
jgi:hypothetical protein